MFHDSANISSENIKKTVNAYKNSFLYYTYSKPIVPFLLASMVG